ncbi:RICIN domain-containing protein [Streptomyces sp. NPDC000888]
MRMAHFRRAATGLATVLAATVALFVPIAPASADVSTISPKSVTYYQFVNLNSLLCLDVGGQTNGSVVQQYTCNGTVNQQWALYGTDSGYFQLVVASSGRCMEVAGASQDTNHRIQVADCTGAYNQQWVRQPSGREGWPRIAARHSGKCMQPLAGQLPMVQFPCNTSFAQQWNIS